MNIPERFATCVMLMAIDNGFTARRPDYWPGFLDYDWIENKLKPLTEVEIETLCTGEEADQDAIIEKHKLALINDLIGSIFDGDLHQHFYTVPKAET